MQVTRFIARQTEEDDYETLVQWWNYYRFPPPAQEFLPDNGKCGLMVTDQTGEIMICAGFIYETNSSVCWMELIVANPEIKDKDKRKKALNFLISELSELAHEWGYKWIFTSVKHESLTNRYFDCGFQLGTTDTKEMIKQL